MVAVAVVVVFHPVVACSFAGFLGFVLVMVLMRVLIVAHRTFFVSVGVFHPGVARSLALFLGRVLIVVFVRVHVVADVVLFAVLVAVFVAVFVAVVVMVCASHGSNGHAERFHVFCLELEHVFAGFEVVHGNHGA